MTLKGQFKSDEILLEQNNVRTVMTANEPCRCEDAETDPNSYGRCQMVLIHSFLILV